MRGMVIVTGGEGDVLAAKLRAAYRTHTPILINIDGEESWHEVVAWNLDGNLEVTFRTETLPPRPNGP